MTYIGTGSGWAVGGKDKYRINQILLAQSNESMNKDLLFALKILPVS